MARHNFILNSEVVEGQDVFSAAALEGVKIFDLEMVLIPLQFKARPICHQSL